MEEVLRLLLSGGPFGLLAGVFWYQLHGKEQELKAYREKMEALLQTLHTNTHAEHTRLRDAFDRDKDRLHDEHSEELREHREQMNELRNAHAAREQQSMQTVEHFARASVEAVEELGKIAAELRRAYEYAKRR